MSLLICLLYDRPELDASSVVYISMSHMFLIQPHVAADSYSL